MKIIIGLSGVLIVVLSLAFYFSSRSLDTDVVTNLQKPSPAETVTPLETTVPPSTSLQTTEFLNKAYNFSFNYRTNPVGYSIFESSKEQSKNEGKLFSVSIIRSDEYEDAQKAAASGSPFDGPSSINVAVVDGRGVTDINAWLVTNKAITNCEEGTVLATVVDDKDASGCAWDGLFSSYTIALLNGGFVYLFTGNMDEGENANGYSPKKDFEAVIASFKITL